MISAFSLKDAHLCYLWLCQRLLYNTWMDGSIAVCSLHNGDQSDITVCVHVSVSVSNVCVISKKCERESHLLAQIIQCTHQYYGFQSER